VFISPVPEDLGAYYPPSYPAYEIHSDQFTGAPDSLDQNKLSIVRRHVTGGRLLEIGPGSGGFLRVAKEAGFHVEAVEMDQYCCDFLRETLGIATVHTQNIISSLATLPSYDVIVLWHVIEHLPSPKSVFEHLVKHLNPDGVLVLTAPNPKSLHFRFFGRYWVHLDAPRHLVLIPPSWLAGTASDLHLDTVFVSTKDEVCRAFSNFGWLEASLSNVQKGSSKGNSAFLPLPKIVRGILYRALFKPAERIQGFGSTYTIVFRKRNMA
jgi:SAM-dependent methyltransferase